MRDRDQPTVAKRFALFLAASSVIGVAGALIGYSIPENHPDDRIQNTVVLGLTLFALSMLVLYLLSLIRRRVFSRLDAVLLFTTPFLAVFLFWCGKGGHGQTRIVYNLRNDRNRDLFAMADEQGIESSWETRDRWITKR